MGGETRITKPVLPENLDNLRQHIEEIRAESTELLGSEQFSKDNIDIIYAGLGVIFDITNSYDCQTDDELTIQFLGLRLFNTISSSIELLLSGYCQSSVVLMRDLLETGYLLDFFTINSDKIDQWKNCTNKERQRKFQPAKVRQALDKRDGFEERSRERIYQTVCEYAVHPTYMGNKLVAPDGLGLIGPFFDSRYLRALLKELAMRVPYFVLVYLAHFPDLPSEFAPVKDQFVADCAAWSGRYAAADQVHLDTSGLSELV